MKKKNKIPKIFIIDVDGVLNTGQFLYDVSGKKFKIFGPDDSDALKILNKYIKILFISGDKRGFNISKKRVIDMGFDIKLVDTLSRFEWIQKNYKSDEIIYMGDGIFDYLVFKKVYYSICPSNADMNCLKFSSFVTARKGGERALSEACDHILKVFFNQSFKKILS